jgi:ethanolamine utilization protein EutJ
LESHTADSIDSYLSIAESVIQPSFSRATPSFIQPGNRTVHVGVDLGTAYIVLVVLDEAFQPIAGEYQFAQVVRDGLVVDFVGAIDILRGMKNRVEDRIGMELNHAATGYPPGVPMAEVRATAYVLDASGLSCSSQISEPVAANKVIGLHDGAIVDVGGGTTGIAIIKDEKVIYTADEPTGGTHFSLVIAGAMGISFEEAEDRKKDPAQQKRLFPVIRPVMEKVSNIVTRHLDGKEVFQIKLVGGTASFPGMAEVMQEYTGIITSIPSRPLFVTPLGIAMHDVQ